MDEELTAHPHTADFDLDLAAERLGALPDAPLAMPHQVLEARHGLRLRVALSRLSARITALLASIAGHAPWPGRLEH